MKNKIKKMLEMVVKLYMKEIHLGRISLNFQHLFFEILPSYCGSIVKMIRNTILKLYFAVNYSWPRAMPQTVLFMKYITWSVI